MHQDLQKQCSIDSKEIIQNNSFSTELKFFNRILKTAHVCEIEKRVEGCVLKCKFKCSDCFLENQCRSLFNESIPYLLEPDTQTLKKKYPEWFI